MNAIFEGHPLDLAPKNAGLIKNLLLTAFYAPALPICLVFTLGGLFFLYWADKCTILRRYALPRSLGSEITEDMIEHLEWAAFFFALGNMMFTYTLLGSDGEDSFENFSGEKNTLVWVAIIISLVHIFLPMESINEKIFKIEDRVTEEITSKEARFDFLTDYDCENPITYKKARKEFTKSLQKRMKKDPKLAEHALGGKLSPDALKNLLAQNQNTTVQEEEVEKDPDQEEDFEHALDDFDLEDSFEDDPDAAAEKNRNKGAAIDLGELTKNISPQM
mmetsp:Transcript_24055/g.21070  ORF Transcript_24055/g.21070 Transcript_24055/m.21070 type:complete len:276 (-) Transcript_24055:448-1275(-)|eukprot:CAMPEP_0114591182 /NCGR_PEP_ID=MMETSP0125-20121206/13296_1 /TAXON_ID=485358 ORGANISM="Aristerostoma sp., Strain ATCC 50986" /NCGR_SAMPLE_ID=MMETSP0125 /ASSEMBLY_ACC=CAM_ASM_000245 /LENGTH=275 /DNA_ID=CAMNT_0001789145 /DNA_START=1733 /DNA_END=2560 /DNA_ORIENTATION=+